MMLANYINGIAHQMGYTRDSHLNIQNRSLHLNKPEQVKRHEKYDR